MPPPSTIDDGGSQHQHHLSRRPAAALEEGHLPTEIEPGTLNVSAIATTRAPSRAPSPRIPRSTRSPASAFFGYNARGTFSPALSFGTVSAAKGVVTRFDRFERAMRMHELHRHETRCFPILLSGSMDRAMRGGPPYAWEPEKGAYGRRHETQRVRQTTSSGSFAESCYVFHVMNAWEEGNPLIARRDAVRGSAGCSPIPTVEDGPRKKSRAR